MEDFHHHHHHPEFPEDLDSVTVPDCEDQLALFSRVGRGLKGDSFVVRIVGDSDMETYLEGLTYDESTHTYNTEWITNNINGGRLDYQYNIRSYTNPQTFTITFRYRRPGHEEDEWAWTTPAIPYTWDADNDGTADVDDIVGTGVATLFIKKTTEPTWITSNIPTSHTILEALQRQEKLLYPDSWLREQFNAPVPGDPWTVNLTYGVNGDIDAPNIDDLSKVLGITVENIRNIIANYGDEYPTATIPDVDYKHYVDRRDAEDKEHIHNDMGFGQGANSQFVDDGGAASGKWTHPIATSGTGSTGSTARTVKGYIDEGDKILRDRIKNLEDEYNTYVTQTNKYIANLYGLIKQLADHMPGVTMSNTAPGATRTPNENGILTFPTGENIAVGNINLYSESDKSGYIKTHTGSDANKDLWAR